MVILVAVLALSGCGTKGGDAHLLDGTVWRLSGWRARSLDPSDFTITARFADGRISGDSAVNAYSGACRAGSDGGFSVGELTVGAVGSVGPEGRAEQAYIALLGEARSFKRSGRGLTLFDGRGRTSLVFRELDSPANDQSRIQGRCRSHAGQAVGTRPDQLRRDLRSQRPQSHSASWSQPSRGAFQKGTSLSTSRFRSCLQKRVPS